MNRVICVITAFSNDALCLAVPPALLIAISRAIIDVFSLDVTLQDVYQDGARNQFYLTEVLQDCCFQMLLASVKEKNVTPQARI